MTSQSESGSCWCWYWMRSWRYVDRAQATQLIIINILERIWNLKMIINIIMYVVNYFRTVCCFSHLSRCHAPESQQRINILEKFRRKFLQYIPMKNKSNQQSIRRENYLVDLTVLRPTAISNTNQSPFDFLWIYSYTENRDRKSTTNTTAL